MDIYLIRHTRVATAAGICYGRSDVPVAVTYAEDEAAVRAKLAGQGLFPSGSLPDKLAAQIKKKSRGCSALHGLQKSVLTDVSG